MIASKPIRKTTATEILDAAFTQVLNTFIDINRVAAHIPVELVLVESVGVAVRMVSVRSMIAAVRMVAAVEAIGMVSAGVPAVPSVISVECIVVVKHSAARPITSPRRPSPPAAGQRSGRDSSTEREGAPQRHISSAVSGRHVRVSVNRSGIVLRDVDDVWVRRLNHNRLRCLLLDRHL